MMHTANRPARAPGFLLAVLSAAALAAAPACSRSQAATPPAKAERPVVAVARAARTDLAETLTLAAEFRPFQEIDVHAKVAGYLKQINVDVGDRVKAGQLLAVLEVPELQDEMQQDEAAVKRSVEEEINRAQADLERAESAHEVAHLGSTRLTGVLKARPTLVAQQDVDEATASDRVAEAQMATARRRWRRGAAARRGAGRRRTRRRRCSPTRGSSRPFAGVITHRYADTGAMIQAGTSSQTQAMPVVKLSQNDRCG